MPVLTLKAAFNGGWECSICCEEYNSKTVLGKLDGPWRTFDADFVCTTCITQQFEKALEFDYNWPARWGGEDLILSDYESFLPSELVSAVTEKAAAMAAIDKTGLLDAVKDLKIGDEYQICPKPECRQIITLRDGCNHMDCILCLTNFCYLCGEEVKDPHRSDHWSSSRGICTRYGPVSSGKFDNMGGEDDESYYGDGMDDDDSFFGEHDEEYDRRNEWADRQQARDRADFLQIGALHVETFAWNVAMNSLRDDALGQQHLWLVIGPTATKTRSSWVGFEYLLRQHGDVHVVPQQEWEALFQAAMPHIRTLYDDGPDEVFVVNHDRPSEESRLINELAGWTVNDNGSENLEDPEPIEHAFLHRGLLSQPVAGVFNMMSPTQRVEAFKWVWNTILNWDNEVSDGSPQSSAVFDMGPGGDEDERVCVAGVMDYLRNDRICERVTSTPMQNAGLLITVGPPTWGPGNTGDEDTLPGEAFWRRIICWDLWGALVCLDPRRKTDSNNPTWMALMLEANNDWDEQRPPREDDVGSIWSQGDDSFLASRHLGRRENEEPSQDFASFHIETWARNLVFQHGGGRDISNEELRANSWAMFGLYRPEHAVPEQEWAALYEAARIGNMFDRVPRPTSMIGDNDFLTVGQLSRPVAGVFNMMSASSRLDAFMWMYNTSRNWDNLRPNQRSAVFDIGPGGDHETRERVVELLFRLRVLVKRFEHFDFYGMQNAGLLVTASRLGSVEARDGSVFVPGEAYWRRVPLREMWGWVVHLDRDMVREPGNIMWRNMMQDASDAWLEQRPLGTLGEEFDF